jgi:hypothetical protein
VYFEWKHWISLWSMNCIHKLMCISGYSTSAVCIRGIESMFHFHRPLFSTGLVSAVIFISLSLSRLS